MTQQYYNFEGEGTLSVVHQALVYKENLQALGSVLQTAYGERVSDDIFVDLIETLDSIGTRRLNHASTTLDRLLRINLSK